MKPPLDRTTILSRDVSEQPPGRLIVFLPNTNAVLTADRVESTAEAVKFWDAGGGLVAVAHPDTHWLAVSADRLEITTREKQIRRSREVELAEEGLEKELGIVRPPSLLGGLELAGPISGGGEHGHGQYL